MICKESVFLGSEYSTLCGRCRPGCFDVGTDDTAGGTDSRSCCCRYWDIDADTVDTAVVVTRDVATAEVLILQMLILVILLLQIVVIPLLQILLILL